MTLKSVALSLFGWLQSTQKLFFFSIFIYQVIAQMEIFQSCFDLFFLKIFTLEEVFSVAPAKCSRLQRAQAGFGGIIGILKVKSKTPGSPLHLAGARYLLLLIAALLTFILCCLVSVKILLVSFHHKTFISSSYGKSIFLSSYSVGAHSHYFHL